MHSLAPGAPEQPRVLVVDDEKYIRDILADFLDLEGFTVRTAEDGAHAVRELAGGHFDMVISDLKMPKMGGLELLKEVSKTHPDTLTIIMTGFGTVETAIDAMKQGAYDYILKPFKIEEIVHIVQRGLQKQRLAAENIRLREALSLYKVSEAISASLSLDEIVSTLTDCALHELRADAVSMWLEDGEGGYFERATEIGPSAPGTPKLGQLAVPTVLLRLGAPHNGNPPSSVQPSSVSPVSSGSGPYVLEHGPALASLFLPGDRTPPVSAMIVRLATRERLIGWVCALSYTEGKRFDEGQRKLLTIVASRAAAAIDNARLYEHLQATFKQTIQSLARTIDKMDRYTAGHSERVALYAAELARWLGLDDTQVEFVRQAALMHDIGKVGCVMNLNKAGKLTQDEYEIFKMHPGYGRDILDPIEFLAPVIPGVYLHHERWDGKGYPLGLKSSEIPLIARIISVADTYDAMTSNRSYRRALPHEVSIAEIERCSCTQFDPDVAGTFVEQIERHRDELRDRGEEVPE